MNLLQLQGLYTPGPGAYEVKPVEKHAPQVLHPFAHGKKHSRDSDMRKIWWRVAASRATESRPTTETLLMLTWLQETPENNRV